MISIADGSVHIQTSSESQPATPSWLGEVALVASHLQKQGILNKISERVRFARRRFGRYDVIDFLAVLFGYAIWSFPDFGGWEKGNLAQENQEDSRTPFRWWS